MGCAAERFVPSTPSVRITYSDTKQLFAHSLVACMVCPKVPTFPQEKQAVLALAVFEGNPHMYLL